MRPFQPAIYICHDCNIEHYGDAQTLPMGWDRFSLPGGRDIARCGGCAERVERDHIDAVAHADSRRRAPNPLIAPTAILHMGRTAAAYRGALTIATPGRAL